MDSFMKPLDDIVALVQTIYSSKKQIKANDMQFIQSEVQKMKNSIIDTLIPLASNTPKAQKQSPEANTSQSSPSSYAAAAKRSQKATIVIKPSNNTAPTLQEIEGAVCKHLDHTKMPATIHTIKSSSNGNVVLKLNASDNTKVIAESISTSLGMEARAKTLQMPKMTLTHIPSHVVTSDHTQLQEFIIASNPWLKDHPEKDFHVLFTYVTNNHTNAVCKMSPNTRQAIFNHNCNLKIGVKVCRLFDRFHIPICTKCSSIGHKASACSSTISVCSFCCSNSHPTNCCPHKDDKSKHRCAGCSNSKDSSLKDRANTHNSFSLECPFYISRKEKLIKSTNWGDGPIPSI